MYSEIIKSIIIWNSRLCTFQNNIGYSCTSWGPRSDSRSMKFRQNWDLAGKNCNAIKIYTFEFRYKYFMRLFGAFHLGIKCIGNFSSPTIKGHIYSPWCGGWHHVCQHTSEGRPACPSRVGMTYRSQVSGSRGNPWFLLVSSSCQQNNILLCTEVILEN